MSVKNMGIFFSKVDVRLDGFEGSSFPTNLLWDILLVQVLWYITLQLYIFRAFFSLFLDAIWTYSDKSTS